MIGRTLKNYRIDEMLGKGGMGVVYRARDLRLDRPVALKVLPPDLVRDEDRRRRFVQEAKAASAVNHPAIAQIFEIEEDGETTFIVMEFVDGATVRQLAARRELDVAAAVEIGAQVADALGRAHEAGIVHRDIKSDNIMVTKDGHPKVLDFGLAKLLDPARGGEGGDTSLVETLARTQAGMIVGTLAYMSPEQARGQPADRRSDVFSFGVVLYEMATGRMPFQGESALDTMHAIAYEQPAPVTSIRADLPYSLHRVIERCLRKKPEDRYQDMREVASDLKSVKREVETGVSGGAPVMERVRGWVEGLTPRGAVWGAVIGAVLGGLLVLVFVGGEGSRVGPLLFVVGLGIFLYRRFRYRGRKLARKFVKRASSLKEVRLIRLHKDEFTIVADEPTARTYVRLNAYLEAANKKLLRGEPMTMVVRDDVGDEEMKRLLGSPGVQYVRDDTKGSSGARALRRGA